MIVGLLLSLSSITVPWDTPLPSMVFYIKSSGLLDKHAYFNNY